MSEINYSKPKKFRFKKKKPKITNSQKKKIIGYLKDPKVQDYVKGLDNSGKIAFADSLMKMQTDKSFKPDILKTVKEKSDKIEPTLYTVPKSLLHPDVLKSLEPTAGDTLRLSKTNLRELLNKQQKAQGGAKLYFNDDTDTFSYSDDDERELKENLTIIENQIKNGRKPNQMFIDEIIKIDPALGDSLMQEINKVKKDPKKDTGDAIWNWVKKTSSAIGKAWNENVESTNRMVKSPPPNLQKDPKEESKDKPQIKKTEKVELEDNLVSSKDTKEKTSIKNNEVDKYKKFLATEKVKSSDWNKEPYRTYINDYFGVNVFDSDGNLDPNLFFDSDKYDATGSRSMQLKGERIQKMKRKLKDDDFKSGGGKSKSEMIREYGKYDFEQKNKDNPKNIWDYNIKNSGFDSLVWLPGNPDYTDKEGNTGQISQSYIGAYKIHKTSDGQYALFDPLTDDSQLEWDGFGFKRTPKLFKTKRQAEKYVKKAYKNFLKNR